MLIIIKIAKTIMVMMMEIIKIINSPWAYKIKDLNRETII